MRTKMIDKPTCITKLSYLTDEMQVGKFVTVIVLLIAVIKVTSACHSFFHASAHRNRGSYSQE